MREDIKKEHLSLSEQIAKFDAEIADIETQRSEVSHQAYLIRCQLVKDIAFETDSRGKRVYSNEELRRVELELRLESNEQHKALKHKERDLWKQRQELDAQRKLLQAQLDFLYLELLKDSPELIEMIRRESRQTNVS